MNIEKSSFFNKFHECVSKSKSFTLTGLTSFSRLLLLKYIKEISNKKLLFITSTEQLALKYKTDLERLFEINSAILPYQNISCYETMQNNLYDYERQISILKEKPQIVITPCKILTEKFPDEDFFKQNSITFNGFCVGCILSSFPLGKHTTFLAEQV